MSAKIVRANHRVSIQEALDALPGWAQKRSALSFFMGRDDVLVLKDAEGRKAHITLQEGMVPLQKWAADRGDPGGWYIPCDPNKGVWDIAVPDSLAEGVEDDTPPDHGWVPPHSRGEVCEFCGDTGFAPYGCAACGL